MADIFFTSDTHFGHYRILEYCRRPFENVLEMNNTLIRNWNNKVTKDDTVYHLGDFAVNNNFALIADILKSLNGKIVLIKGSHEKSVLNSKCVNRFERIVDNLSLANEKEMVFLAHHCHKVWPKSHYGCWHLFGHSHGGLDDYSKQEGKLLDVGVDSNNFTPLSWDEVIEVMNTRPLNFNSLSKKKNNIIYK